MGLAEQLIVHQFTEELGMVANRIPDRLRNTTGGALVAVMASLSGELREFPLLAEVLIHTARLLISDVENATVRGAVLCRMNGVPAERINNLTTMLGQKLEKIQCER